MSPESELVEKLTTLNRIADSLNQAVDVQSVLDGALADLVELMGLETAWISLRDGSDRELPVSGHWLLAAHHNLPPALDSDNAEAWRGSCRCQELYSNGEMTEAYNEVHCSRLGRVHGDRRGLAVHATVPLRARDRVLGILNVAAPDWESFSPEALSLLTNVGSQMGIAMERARLYDLLQERHINEQAALLHLSNQLLGRWDLDDVMGYLAEEVRQMLSADACALLLPGEEPGTLEFRASSGWHSNPCRERRRVPVDDQSGPGLVMHTQQPLLVEDLQERDPAPWATAWLQTEGFRGHAVIPLLVEDRSVGVLVINQRHARLFEDDLHFLRLMANQAAIAIEKARLHEEEVKGQSLEKELEVGRQIQLTLLPKTLPTVQGWEFATFYQAAHEVGGDFYDLFELPGEPGKLGMVIADVCGKGVPAALFMARGSTVIRGTAQALHSPPDSLVRANDLILQDRKSDLFLTAFYAVLDTLTGRLVYSNAGHNPPFWLQAATGQIGDLHALGTVLGFFEEIALEEREIQVAPGDVLVFYTDGVTEAMDADHQFFDEERLTAILAAKAGASAQEILAAIVDSVKAFYGRAPQSDDLTLLVVRRSPQ